MDSASKPRWPVPLALAAMLASGALLYFGTGLDPVWWLTWLAPLPVLVAVHRSRWSTGVLACIGAWMIGGFNLWAYMHGTLSIPTPIVGLAIAIPGVQFALVAQLSRKCASKGRFGPAVLALPSAWVTLDYLQSLASPHGTFGNLAYSQLDFLPLVQLASLTGVWGVDFLLMLLPSAMAVLFAYPVQRRARACIVFGTAIACVLVLGFGAQRLSQPGGPPARVELIASDKPPYPLPMDDAASQRMLASAEVAIANTRAQHPQFIVLPETIVALDATSYPIFEQRLQSLARASGATIVVGVDLKDDRAERNTALVFSPDNAAVARYAKQHLLPQFEGRYRAGHDLLLGDSAGTRWGVAICKDMDFPALSRRYAQAGAVLMLVPAWDFVNDGRLHARMAVMRGIEGGFAIVRSARTGHLTVSDANGRVLAETSSALAATMVEQVTPGAGETLYARFGDWFAWLALAFAAICILLALRPALMSENGEY